MEWGYLLDNPLDQRHTVYAVVVLLPERLEQAVAPLRERYDPLYNLISPHITLIYPFESDRPLDELTAIIRAEADALAPVPLKLSSIGDFYPRIPKIYWNVEKNDQFCELYYRLYSRLGVPIPYKNYQPHVTVAREISMHRVLLVKEKIIDYLPDESFEISAIDMITPLPGGKWVSVRTFPLTE